MLLILGSLYLSQVASFATTNRAIEALIARRDELKRQNEGLIAEIARFRTVPRLHARASELGFRPAVNADIDYVLIEGYNPSRDRGRELTTQAAPVSQTPAYDETFGSWLEQQFALLREQFKLFGQ